MYYVRIQSLCLLIFFTFLPPLTPHVKVGDPEGEILDKNQPLLIALVRLFFSRIIVECIIPTEKLEQIIKTINESCIVKSPPTKTIKVLFFLLFIFLHYFIATNFFLLAKDMIHGDFSAEAVYPVPRYLFFRVQTDKFEAQNRLAGDFAQIYFPSKNFSELNENYQTGKFDPWNRSSRYAPFVHFLCSKSICNFNYGYASFFHILIQLLLFYISIIFTFRLFKIEEYLLPSILLINLCLFLTPVGLAWFERGQLSLYVALGYLWLLLGLFKRSHLFMIFAGAFAFLKWTSFPFLFVIFMIFLLSSKDPNDFKHNFSLGLAFLLPITFFSIVLPVNTFHFLTSVFEQEGTFRPRGISLALIFPRIVVKLLPLMLILMGTVISYLNKKEFKLLVPFYIGAASVFIIYPTIAYDYSTPILLCFIPFTIYWSQSSKHAVHKILRFTTQFGFYAFIIIASFSNYMFGIEIESVNTIYMYAIFSIVFLLIPFIYSNNTSSNFSKTCKNQTL